MTSKVTEATTSVYDVLELLTPEERQRVVRAALTLLGDSFERSNDPEPTPSLKDPAGKSDDDGDDLSVLAPDARAWVRKMGLTLSSLEHYFHFDQGRAQPIALPGNATSKREQTINAYLAQGLAAYLSSGDSRFTDEQGRELCKQFGCYDSPNHTKAIKGLENRITGSKANGWKLTTPGLSAAANLIK